MAQRTVKQNGSLHQVLDSFALDMNEAGIDFKKTVRLPVSFTKENIKEYMFKPIMSGLYPDVESTADLSTTQMMRVYDVFNAAMAERFGVSHQWPDRFNGGNT